MERHGARPTRAGTPAPQCGTGDLARQIAENGLENVQTPGDGTEPVPIHGKRMVRNDHYS